MEINWEELIKKIEMPISDFNEGDSPTEISSSTESVEEEIEILPEYLAVKEVIDSKEYNMIFVTGGAGTGKSTLIRWLLKEYDGRVLLGAPTGIAAINIGGKTLHSLCQLPLGWILPDEIKINTRRRELRGADVLVIDEISMVNPNVLDAIDLFFQKNRFNKRPFGGLSVVMIGDLFQLPAIISNNCKHLFSSEYSGSNKFYMAHCMSESDYYIIELEKVFRQKDDEFVSILADIREGKNLDDAIARLNARCSILEQYPKGAVLLCPRNLEVDAHNTRELYKIHSEIFKYKGSLWGTFKQNNLPAPLELTLKVGAQVMFTQNDIPDRRWVNGTIGTVVALSSNIITVKLDSDEEVEVGKGQWQDFKYDYDEEEKKIKRVITGGYEQYPLILAWAITIHKSQGQTIDRVHIDLGGGAFEVGQTYVALSRCTSLEGLSLSRPLTRRDILVDTEVSSFYESLRFIEE